MSPQVCSLTASRKTQCVERNRYLDGVAPVGSPAGGIPNRVPGFVSVVSVSAGIVSRGIALNTERVTLELERPKSVVERIEENANGIIAVNSRRG